MAQISSVAGVEGTELTDDVLSQLPPEAPAAPWALESSALMWFAPPSEAAKRALQPGMRGRVLAVAGMMVRYAHTPVGQYGEVIGMLVLQQRTQVNLHVPFIAVDSAASVVGGRANWALPKTLATFEGHPAADRAMRGTHPLWEVSAKAKAFPRAIPMPVMFSCSQMTPEGREERATTRGWIDFRPALVEVKTTGTPDITGWLRSGRFPGMVVDRFDARLGPAKPV